MKIPHCIHLHIQSMMRPGSDLMMHPGAYNAE